MVDATTAVYAICGLIAFAVACRTCTSIFAPETD